MSQENVERPDDGSEVMRRWFDTWNRAEYDAFFDLYDADAVVITDPSWMEAGPFHGRAAIRAWTEGLQEPWEVPYTLTLKELFEAGDKVVAQHVWQVRGKTSGIEQRFDFTSVNSVERGRIVRQQFFDHAEAVEAVGLSE
jgi:ketosteroid isomerase-like protein